MLTVRHWRSWKKWLWVFVENFFNKPLTSNVDIFKRCVKFQVFVKVKSQAEERNEIFRKLRCFHKKLTIKNTKAEKSKIKVETQEVSNISSPSAPLIKRDKCVCGMHTPVSITLALLAASILVYDSDDSCYITTRVTRGWRHIIERCCHCESLVT